MFSKLHNYLLILVVAGVVFVTAGDSFLPKPLNAYSRGTRTSLNSYFVSLFPKKAPKRPSAQREGEVMEFEHRAQPKTPSRP